MKKLLLLSLACLLLGFSVLAQEEVTLRVPIIKTGTATDEDDPTITFDASTDDAEQENNEIDALYDDDIDAGWEGEEGDANILTAGLRFQNLEIPAGAKIIAAHIEVFSHEAKSADDVANLTIYADKTTNAATFTEDALITERPATVAQVKWVVDEAWGLWTKHESPNLKGIVQEIVSMDGWASGNAIAFIITGEDQGPSEVENAREWEAFENIADPEDGGDGMNHPERVPALVVTYEEPSTTDNAGALDISIIKTTTAEDEDDPTITFDASTDDAEQENDEIDALFDDDIDAGWEGEEGDANILTAGLRFQDVSIPQGAVIDSAFIVVVSHEAKSEEDVAKITIYGDATDNAGTFTEDALITDRPATTSSVNWTVNEAWGLWTTHKTADVKSIIQEIVDRDGWSPGNALAFILSGEDQGPSEVENAREWEAFENIADPEDGGDGRNYPDRAPRLVVYYGGYDGEPIVIDRDVESTPQGAIAIPIVKTGTATDEDDPTITFDASSDDAEQENDEIDALYDDDIDAGWEGEEGDANILTAGLRFQNVEVPQGATIDSVFIQVFSHEAKSSEDVANLTIFAEATDDAETFSEEALITDRASTTAQVTWTVNEPWGLWTEHRTPDLKTIVQELVNREGWEFGNSMAFVITGENQGPSEVENAREWEAFENIADPEDGGDGMNHPERVPRLIIYFDGYSGDPIAGSGDDVTEDGVTSVEITAEVLSSVYPNPTSNLVTLVLPSTEEASISLIDMKGGKLIRKFSNNGLKEIKMNLSSLENGVYLISVNQSGTTFNKRVILR